MKFQPFSQDSLLFREPDVPSNNLVRFLNQKLPPPSLAPLRLQQFSKEIQTL